MARYNNYQTDFAKYAGHANTFKAPRITTKKNRTEQWRERIIDWNTYYRRNIHRFVQHYFGVKLHFYQILWIYFMSLSTFFVAIASRATAKSWLIGLYALAKGVLYPNSEIVIVASTQKQAAIILGKIEQLKNDYPNIAREIASYRNAPNDKHCNLLNGSTIKVVACNEENRGHRATLVIAEEFRLMNKKKYDSIVKPFKYVRQVPYLKQKEYKHLQEEPQEIMISSAYHKSMWWYDTTVKTIKALLEGKNVGFVAFDYLTSIKHGIKTKNLIEEDKSNMDAITFLEEYENIPFGENSNSYFKLNMFEKNRNIKKAFYPLRRDMFDKKKNPFNIPKVDGEIRIISADIATRSGEENDNSCFSCIRALPTQKGYQREVVYIETHHGEHTGKQALRIKQLFVDFEADYIVLDTQNAGIAVFERLAEVTKDEERGIEYDAFTVFEHHTLKDSDIEELKKKTLSKNAKPIIYPIAAYRKMNSEIAVQFRDKLQRKMISFLVSEADAEVYLNKHNKEFKNTDDIELQNWFLMPYLETELLIKETINLEFSVSGGDIVLSSGSRRKDRYTSVSYGNYFIHLLELKLLKQDESDYDFVFDYS